MDRYLRCRHCGGHFAKSDVPLDYSSRGSDLLSVRLNTIPTSEGILGAAIGNVLRTHQNEIGLSV